VFVDTNFTLESALINLFFYISDIHLCGTFCSMLPVNNKTTRGAERDCEKSRSSIFHDFSNLFCISPVRSGPARPNSWTEAIKIVNSPEIMHRARFTTASKNRSLLYKIMVLQRRAQTRDSKERDGGINRVNRI